MQTFLTHGNNFEACAYALDSKRLGKQRVECLQILQTLQKGDAARAWKNHPAVKMWRGYEPLLARYGLIMCREWVARGFVDNCQAPITEFLDSYTESTPDWIYAEELQITHRGRLYVKNPLHYWQWEEEGMSYIDYTCCSRCDYWWPTHLEK